MNYHFLFPLLIIARNVDIRLLTGGMVIESEFHSFTLQITDATLGHLAMHCPKITKLVSIFYYKFHSQCYFGSQILTGVTL